jgi:hypothetical protein
LVALELPSLVTSTAVAATVTAARAAGIVALETRLALAARRASEFTRRLTASTLSSVFSSVLRTILGAVVRTLLRSVICAVV